MHKSFGQIRLTLHLDDSNPGECWSILDQGWGLAATAALKAWQLSCLNAMPF